MDDQKKRIKAANALEFLRNHPALNPEVMGDSLFDGAWFDMARCCKRGLSEGAKRGVNIYRGDKGWERFKKRFDREWEEDYGDRDWKNEEEYKTYRDTQFIDVSYKEKFGEPWRFDHVEYWYELTFFIFEGNPYNDEYIDFKKWMRYGGPEGGANTFEDMIIKAARDAKKAYGNFNIYKDFITPEEKKNNEEESMFIRDADGRINLNLKRNSNYAPVYNSLINLRWLEWFMETDYCKKNWTNYKPHDKLFKSLVKKIDRVPKKRAEILARYK